MSNVDEIAPASEAERAAALSALQAREAAAAGFKVAVESGQAAPAEATGRRGFVAPVEKNTRILVKAGKPLSFPDKDSPRGQKMVEREGDIMLEFRDGLTVLDPAEEGFDEKLSWCLAHPEVCREVSDPMTEVWYQMKDGQLHLSNRDATVPASIDVDAALRGDPRGYSAPGSITERARKHLDASA